MNGGGGGWGERREKQRHADRHRCTDRQGDLERAPYLVQIDNKLKAEKPLL